MDGAQIRNPVSTRGWAESVTLPSVVPTSGSRPPSGHLQPKSRQSSASRRRETTGLGEESMLPSIPSTPREQQERQHLQASLAIAATAGASAVQPSTEADDGHGQEKMRLFDKNLEKFIKGGGCGEGGERRRGRGKSRDNNSEQQRESSSSSAAASSSNTPRGQKGRKKISDEAGNAHSVLAAAYGVSPYMQEMKIFKKKLQPAEPSIDESKGTRPEQAHRKKYIKMLKNMEEEAKRVKEDAEKKLLQQQEAAAKLRAKIGVDKIAGRLLEPKRAVLEEGEEGEEAGGGRKKPAGPEPEEEEDDQDPVKLAAKKAKAKEDARRNKAILERTQRMLQQITDKRQEQEGEDEAKLKREEKMRAKLRKAAKEVAERAREEEGEEGAVRGRRKDTEEDDGPPSPKRGDVEKAIQNRARRCLVYSCVCIYINPYVYICIQI